MTERAAGDSMEPWPGATPPAAAPVPAPPPAAVPAPPPAAPAAPAPTAPAPTAPAPVAPAPVAGEVPYAGPVVPHQAPMPYPVTAAPFPFPAATHPVTAAPYPFGVMTPPPARKGWVIALSITTGVLLLVAGALGGLWYMDHDRATRTSADQQAQIDELRSQVERLEDDLEDAETQRQRAEDDLAAAQACPDAVQAYIDAAVAAAAAGQEELPPEAQSLVLEMINACDVAP